MPRNVVILFNNEITSKLIGWSEKINKIIPSKIILNRIDQIPHLSIYSTNFPDYNLKKIDSILSLLIKKHKPFLITFSTKVVDMKSIFINADPNKKLYELHQQIVDGLNSLRDGHYDEKELAFIGDNKERRESLIKYGMWAAKELYVPHITISRPIDENQCHHALELLPKKFLIKSLVNKVSLVERGPNGTCKKIIKSYSFSE